MLKTLNKYCSNCRGTKRFLDLSTHLLCECCSKRLDRIRTEKEKRLHRDSDSPFDRRTGVALPAVRREAM